MLVLERKAQLFAGTVATARQLLRGMSGSMGLPPLKKNEEKKNASVMLVVHSMRGRLSRRSRRG